MHDAQNIIMFHRLAGREKTHAVCAELEKIIWGETRPETQAALAEVAREIEDLIAADKAAEDEKARQKVEEARRREEERAGRERLRRADEVAKLNVERAHPRAVRRISPEESIDGEGWWAPEVPQQPHGRWPDGDPFAEDDRR